MEFEVTHEQEACEENQWHACDVDGNVCLDMLIRKSAWGHGSKARCSVEDTYGIMVVLAILHVVLSVRLRSRTLLLYHSRILIASQGLKPYWQGVSNVSRQRVLSE